MVRKSTLKEYTQSMEAIQQLTDEGLSSAIEAALLDANDETIPSGMEMALAMTLATVMMQQEQIKRLERRISTQKKGIPNG